MTPSPASEIDSTVGDSEAPAQTCATGPSRRLVRLLGYWCLAALAVSGARIWQPQSAAALENLWWLAGSLLLAAALLDFLTGRRVQGLQGERQLPGNLALGVENRARLTLRNSGPRALALTVSDSLPAQLSAEQLPRRAQLDPGQQVTIDYPLVPHHRGRADFGPIEVLADSPWRLWQTRVRLGQPQSVKVYPNFLGISSLQSLSTEQSLRFLGLHQQQRRGEGMDFRQLREYRQGDSQRQVDWRASARLRKLISREYQDERDQEIVYMLDCGRRMRAKDGELSHFDHALNALLLSAYVAIKQGDAVGLHAFAADGMSSGGQLPPVKGKGGINLLLNHVYDLHSGTANADFSGAAQQLLAKHPRRALVILVTNLRDEDSDELLAAVQLLSRRHLVMVASLRETAVDQLLHKPVESFADAIDAASARDFLQRRARLLQQLRARNVLVVDSAPDQLHMALVETYWQLKRSGRI
ncbi:DUF58 domain-containing protein [Microbulbifer marinus]|uniref:Uncharacterized conserved protein, DUF58 family, contains vWF domain n=1 Tax=Microbulbifer marinus TaxID=658218 RepID=A0A1H3YRP8_9GAMM|nr:DUF58 domain-containing protein [Microbulbifer marinus]SEA14213.1 Uncharacterized conserved protein, DUF58 family, contains vWF domain [Microbulbifer marinus]